MTNTSKKACVLRIGGIGDLIMATPIFPLLKDEGYKVHVITRPYLWAILRNNPHVDKIKNWKHGDLSAENFNKVCSKYEKEYDKFINLSGSIEGNLLALENTDKFRMPKETLRSQCNKNYYEETLSWAGYGHSRDYKPKLYLSREEEKHGENYRRTLKSKVILWSMTGSSLHKVWPYTEEAILELLEENEDLTVITVGEGLSHWIEPKHERAINRAGIWSLRRSIVMAKYSDLVVSSDTGLAHIAAAFDIPQIVLLTSASPENITKHWGKAVPIIPKVECYPCHKLMHYRNYCKTDILYKVPICIAGIEKETVKEKIKEMIDG